MEFRYLARFFYLFVFLFVFSVHSFSANFYVSPLGSDSNSGSKDSPFLTINRAQKAVLENRTEDCTVWLFDGIYKIRKPIVFNTSDFGKADRKIAFKAYKDASPIISGGEEISDWKQDDNGLWVANVNDGDDFRELFIDGKRATRARFPNSDYLRVKKVGKDRRTNFSFQKNEFPIPEKTEDVELVLLHDWSISRIGVKEINKKKKRLTAVDSIGAKNPDFFNLDHWEAHPRYFLENDMAFLDADYEWYFNARQKNLYLQLPENLTPAEHTIVKPISEGLVRINGSENKSIKNIRFEGITFQYCAWQLPKLGYCGVQACHFDSRPPGEGWAVVPAAIKAEWAENIAFDKCDFKNFGTSGLWFSTGCNKCTVSNSSFNDISGNGIMLGEGRDRLVNGKVWWKASPEQVAIGNSIKNCVLTHCGIQFYGAVGIWCGLTAKTTIENNEVAEMPYSGISIGWEWSPVSTPCRENVIDGNHIHNILNILSDGGGIYMLGLQPGSKLVNNHIHDVKINAGRAESNGMFLDEGTTDVVVANNLIYNIAKSPLRFHKATTNLVKENYLFCTDENPPIRYNRTAETDIEKVDNKVFRDTDTIYGSELKKAKDKWNE